MIFWNHIEKFLLILLVVCLLFFIQQYRIFSISHINPNLVLLSLVLLLFFNPGLLSFLAVIISIALVMFITTPYWSGEFAILFALIVAFLFVKKLLTGDRFIDFIIILSASTIIFYIALGVFLSPFVSPLTLLKEVLYNIILGSLAWFVLDKSELSYK